MSGDGVQEAALGLQVVRSGGKRELARALSKLEINPDDPRNAALLDEALAQPLGLTLGMTGPPGVGKSSLIDVLIEGLRKCDLSVAVIAVDPSSSLSGGALLGDRTRFTNDPTDRDVFVRSMAARDQLGGLSSLTFPAMVLMRALFDVVLIETVGIGQSETMIAELADRTIFCAQPGLGDALQFLKAGIMEVPDLILVTKSDLGQIAERTASDLRGALSLTGDVPVMACSAMGGAGIDEVVQEICTLRAQISPLNVNDRNLQVIRWAKHQISMKFGTVGYQLVHRELVDNPADALFQHIFSQNARLSAALTEAFR